MSDSSLSVAKQAHEAPENDAPGAYVVVGMGQLGSLFAEGWLKLGYPVIPKLRHQSFDEVEAQLAGRLPRAVLIAVGETALPQVLAELPTAYGSRVLLVQNELLPVVWQQARPGLQVSGAVVWFEKKGSAQARPLRASVLFGPQAELLAEAYQRLELPYRIAGSAVERDFELVLKNLYILGLNLGGLAHPGNAANLWFNHAEFARGLVGELIELQSAQLGRQLAQPPLFAGLEEAILATPEQACRGRTAEERLARALAQAERYGLKLPVLSSLNKFLA